MTPEERAAQVCFPEHNRVIYDHIVMVIRAAIAERDRAWRDAWATCGHFQEMTACPGSCPLRSLLAAGKGRTE